MAKIVLLINHFDWLKSALMPLLDSDAHTVLSESFDCLDELLECVVALGVKLAVLEEFIHSLLLPAREHLLE